MNLIQAQISNCKAQIKGSARETIEQEQERICRQETEKQRGISANAATLLLDFSRPLGQVPDSSQLVSDKIDEDSNSQKDQYNELY